MEEEEATSGTNGPTTTAEGGPQDSPTDATEKANETADAGGDDEEEECGSEKGEGVEGGAEEEEAEQPVSSFAEEDSTSRDSAALHDGLAGDESTQDPISDKLDFVDEGQSMDAPSHNHTENSQESSNDDKNGNGENGGEESCDSKLSTDSKEKRANGQGANADFEGDGCGDGEMVDLMANESMMEDDEEGENVVAEVDISAMMEINFDEESENQSQDAILGDGEPDIVPLDSDDEGNGDKRQQMTEDGGDAQPVVLRTDEVVYQVDELDNITEVDISSAMPVDVAEDSSESRDSMSTPSRRPRRAAAEAAAKTIHRISAAEEGIEEGGNRRRSQEDKEYNVYEEMQPQSPSQSTKQKCLVCKKIAACSIVIRQYGVDVYLCSNVCFSKFRNEGTDSKRKALPCSKCGIMENESVSKTTYFWETMNFCSDLCVGRYQIDVGSKCCTCGDDVPWNSLGKYCVRFGSDIRQFCTPSCLESYKKNARVCFHCQLDIRRAGNVILANIPSKTTPKEFCSNDCVEMYCERNMHQPTRAKPQPEHPCFCCKNRRLVHRELVLANGSFKTCSEACWREALREKGVSKAEKCEMCTKFVNMDLGFTTPVYWISTISRVHGFCSHVCKNLYILNNRKILACTSCKVKKYNYDLIEYFVNFSSNYAVCSLACLPKSSDYLKNIREVIYLPQPTCDRTNGNFGRPSVPVISSVTSIQPQNGQRTSRRKQGHDIASFNRSEIIELDEDTEEEIRISDSDNIFDSLTSDEVQALIQMLENRSKTRDMMCMAKPKTRTVETQTDISELNDMERIPLVPDEVVHYVPVPLPTLVHVPFPGYFLESPCPVPFPVPIPVPIPIPVIIPSKEKAGNLSTSARETNNDNDDDDKDGDVDGRHSSNNSSTETSLNKEKSLATDGRSASDTSSSKPSSEKRTGNDVQETRVKRDIEITAEYAEKAILPHNSLTPTPSTPTPEQVRRGSTQSFPSPSYSQENTFHPTSIFPSPISNYSPTYGSTSPVPQLTPVAPVPVRPPSVTVHHGPSAVPQPVHRQLLMSRAAPQVSVSGTYSFHDMTPRYMSSAPAPPALRPPPVVPPVGSGYGTHSSTSSMGYANAPPPSLPISTFIPQHSTPKTARVENALRAWKMMFGPASDPRSISPMELSVKLCDMVNRGCKPNGERYRADILLLISLGIQQFLRENNRVDKLFYDNMYYNFVLALTDRAERELTVGIHAKIDESHFWESSELGASSPGVLLFTLIFMFYKHFGLKTWEMHAGLQFSNVVVQSRYDHYGRIVKYMSVIGVPGIVPVEIPEDVNRPERCFIKIYEFYCFKSEIQHGPFYKCLRQDYTPRTPWFTSLPLDQRHIYQMLVRATMISNNNNDGFS